MSIFSRLFRDHAEFLAGKISWLPSVWLFQEAIGRRQRSTRGSNAWPPRTDLDGKDAFLVKGRSAQCTAPGLWEGTYPRLWDEQRNRQYFTVLQADCKACQHHTKRSRLGSCCDYDAAHRKATTPSPLQLVNQAVQQAHQMLNPEEKRQ